MAGRYDSRSGDGIVRVETDAAAQVVARSSWNQAQRCPAATEQMRRRRGVDAQMHHPVAAHHREHVRAVLDRTPGHRLCLGEITAQQDLQVCAPITERAGHLREQLESTDPSRRMG